MARLEQEGAKVNRDQARALKDGHVGAKEQAGVQRAENKQGKKIPEEKNDTQTSRQLRYRWG